MKIPKGVKYAIQIQERNRIVYRLHRTGKHITTFSRRGHAESFAMKLRDKFPGIGTMVVAI